MEPFEQLDIPFYAEDFRFHISKQGSDGSGLQFPFHWHKYIEILYCLSGRVRLFIENTEYLMTAGDLALIGPNVVHRTFKEKDDPGILYNLLFDTAEVQCGPLSADEAKCANAFLNCLSSFNHYYLKKENVPADMESLLKKAEQRYLSGEIYDSIYLRAHLMEMIGMLCQNGSIEIGADMVNNRTLNEVRKTAAYIQSHCNEKLTLSDMAMKANLSYHYYARLFKQVTGKSFALYLAYARIFMAEKLMLEGAYSLQEIADKVGLYPQSYFNHTYKKLRGYTPKEFMKRFGDCT